MTYPAKFGMEIEGVITVGAYDTTSLTISPFSNFSPNYVEVQAPGSMNSGQGLISTYPGNEYAYLPGTSMATPLVAGLVALVELYLQKQGVTMSPAAVETLIKESSLEYQSLSALAENGRVINYLSTIQRLVQIYEAGIRENPRDLNLLPGQSGRFAVRMSQYTSQLQFQWYHNGDAITGANEIEYNLRSVQSENAGEYYVEVVLESGETIQSLPATLNLLEDNCK
jgi:hypothetical protein